MDRRGAEHVHAAAGGIQFKYDVAQFILGRASPPTQNGVARINKEHTDDVENEAVRPDHSDDEALPDFLSLGAADDVEDQGPAAAAAAEEADPDDALPPSVVQDLLADYSTLGNLFASPTAVTAAQQAPEEPTAAPPAELPQVPWLASLKGITSPTLRLHSEIFELCRFLEPAPEEAAARHAAIARVQEVVCSIWPEATVEVFGSFATGLYLPTSDVDAVILHSGCDNIPAGLKALATSMARRGIAKNMQVIAKAKVPIVKFEEAESGYAFDVSFDVANGPEAAANIRGIMDRLPPMRPLVMVLKVFLQQRQLNEVYSGGVGSYALLVMVACFLQTHPSRHTQTRNTKDKLHMESNLGALLIDFFRLYGRSLQHMTVGISCRRGGGFFGKRSKGFFNEERPYLMAVEDPNDPSNDLGKNSYNVSRARMAFDYAYCRLTAPVGEGESLIHRIIRLDPALFLRAPPPMPLPVPEIVLVDDSEEEGGNAAAAVTGKKKNKKKGKKRAAEEIEEEEGEDGGEGKERKKNKNKNKKRRKGRSSSPVVVEVERGHGEKKGKRQRNQGHKESKGKRRANRNGEARQ